jgi:hypothetical protein
MSSNRPRRAARAAVVLGALALLAIPAAVVAAQVLSKVELLRALTVAVPAALVCATAAGALARRARLAQARSVDPRGATSVRRARILAWAGLYAAVTGGLALAVYGVLRLAE